MLFLTIACKFYYTLYVIRILLVIGYGLPCILKYGYCAHQKYSQLNNMFQPKLLKFLMFLVFHTQILSYHKPWKSWKNKLRCCATYSKNSLLYEMIFFKCVYIFLKGYINIQMNPSIKHKFQVYCEQLCILLLCEPNSLL